MCLTKLEIRFLCPGGEEGGGPRRGKLKSESDPGQPDSHLALWTPSFPTC